MISLFCCLLCSSCVLCCAVGIYCVWIVFCNGVVAVNKITAVGMFYIAWLVVALKLCGSAWECGLFVCDLYCRSLFIPLLCDLLVLVTICEDQRRYNMLLLGVCICKIYCYLTHYLLVYGCNGYSGNFSPLFRCRILRSGIRDMTKLIANCRYFANALKRHRGFQLESWSKEATWKT
jgi:hypothetical protein